MNRNNVIFRNDRRDVSSIFHDNLALTVFWTETLNSGQGVAVSFASVDVRGMQQSWDVHLHAQGTINQPNVDMGPTRSDPSEQVDWGREYVGDTP